MIKEKIIFWPLVGLFIAVLIFGLVSQGRKKEAQGELLKEIKLATKKAAARIRPAENVWDFERIKATGTLDDYRLLLKRSPFFRVASKPKAKKVEVIPVKIEPKKPEFKYKGRVMMGTRVMVIIEDQGTGKSYFVKKGDMVGDFLVSRVTDTEVALQKKGGEEIVLKLTKKER